MNAGKTRHLYSGIIICFQTYVSLPIKSWTYTHINTLKNKYSVYYNVLKIIQFNSLLSFINFCNLLINPTQTKFLKCHNQKSNITKKEEKGC